MREGWVEREARRQTAEIMASPSVFFPGNNDDNTDLFLVDENIRAGPPLPPPAVGPGESWATFDTFGSLSSSTANDLGSSALLHQVGPLSPSKAYPTISSNNSNIHGGTGSGLGGGMMAGARGSAFHGNNPCMAVAATSVAIIRTPNTSNGLISSSAVEGMVASPGRTPLARPSSPLSPFHIFAGTQLSPIARSISRGSRGGGVCGGRVHGRKGLPSLCIMEEGDEDEDDSGSSEGLSAQFSGVDESNIVGGGGGVLCFSSGGEERWQGTGMTREPAATEAHGGGAARGTGEDAARPLWVGHRPLELQGLVDDSLDPVWSLGSSTMPIPMPVPMLLSSEESGDCGGGVHDKGVGDAAVGNRQHTTGRLVSMRSINPAAMAVGAATRLHQDVHDSRSLPPSSSGAGIVVGGRLKERITQQPHQGISSQSSFPFAAAAAAAAGSAAAVTLATFEDPSVASTASAQVTPVTPELEAAPAAGRDGSEACRPVSDMGLLGSSRETPVTLPNASGTNARLVRQIGCIGIAPVVGDPGGRPRGAGRRDASSSSAVAAAMADTVCWNDEIAVGGGCSLTPAADAALAATEYVVARTPSSSRFYGSGTYAATTALGVTARDAGTATTTPYPADATTRTPTRFKTEQGAPSSLMLSSFSLSPKPNLPLRDQRSETCEATPAWARCTVGPTPFTPYCDSKEPGDRGHLEAERRHNAAPAEEEAVVLGAPMRKKRRVGSGFDGNGGGIGSCSDEQGRRRGHEEGKRLRPAGKALTGEMMLGTPVAESGGSGGVAVGDGGETRVVASAEAVAVRLPVWRKQVAGTKDEACSPLPSSAGVAKQHNPCTCKKCRCLKLYCDCFAQSRVCGAACLCQRCGNRQDNKALLEARRATLERNPDVFKRARALAMHHPESAMEGAGCRCTKSKCLKKYCVCFQMSVRCGTSCKCTGCMNIVGSRSGRGGASPKTSEDDNDTYHDAAADSATPLGLLEDEDGGLVQAQEALFTPSPRRDSGNHHYRHHHQLLQRERQEQQQEEGAGEEGGDVLLDQPWPCFAPLTLSRHAGSYASPPP